MNNSIARSSLAALALVGMLAVATVAPARADGAATTRTIIAGLAAAAAIATLVNVSQKNAAANRVEGYLPGGSTVYGDGRVVARNGYAWYPGNNGETVSCNGQQCYLTSNGSNNTSYNNGYGTGSYGYGSGYNGYGSGYNGNAYGGYAAPVYGSNVYSGANYGRSGQTQNGGYDWSGNGRHARPGNSGHAQPGNSGQQHNGGGHRQHP